MKKFMFTLTILILASCIKDKDCHCGESVTESIEEIMEQDGDCPEIEVKNICSGNIEAFCFGTGAEDGVTASWTHSPEDYYCTNNKEVW